jgi:antitoxin HigA-1
MLRAAARLRTELETGVAPVCPAVEPKPVVEDRCDGHAPRSTGRDVAVAATRILAGHRLPNRITAHPGEVLREEFLKPLGLSVNGLAAALRVPANRIGAIVKGERSVTPDTALRLGRFFGNSPEFWINLQAMHDLTRARIECGPVINRDIRPRSSE